MTALVIGLVLFLGLHSTSMVADGARSRFIAQRGQNAWRGLYSLGSAIGLVLIVWGYSLTLRQPVVLWSPPAWMRIVGRCFRFMLIAAFTAIRYSHVKNRASPLNAPSERYACRNAS